MGTMFVKLTKTHDVKNFESGNDEVDNWFRTIAFQHQRKRLSATTVLVDQNDPIRVIGFHTIAMRGLLRKEDFPPNLVKGLPQQIPCYTIARLAVSKSNQRQGYGEFLLLHALEQVNRAAGEVGGVIVFVDAKDGATARFYEQYGFRSLPEAVDTLVMLVAEIPT